ncbi:MAG: RNA polymerase subunit sigma [Planctomycetaceae bacterium]|nr:RNA polymerase subunit sigma [Planctomycetaceae bacterium]
MAMGNDPVSDDFTTLVINEHAALRAFIRALGVDRDWVDDLAQETFLVAYRELDSFDQQRDFGKWLRGIARNLVRNEVRKVGRRRRILHENLTDILLTRDEDQSHALDRSNVAALRECVEQLPGKSRDLVSGRYRDGWSADDLADQLDMTAAAVRQALVRIRRKLRTCIEQRGLEG